MQTDVIVLTAIGIAQGLLVPLMIELSFRVVRPIKRTDLLWQLPLALALMGVGGAAILWLPLLLLDPSIRRQYGIFWFGGLFGGMAAIAIFSRVRKAKASNAGQE